MDEPDAEKAKARRALRILVICAVVGVLLPAVLFVMVEMGGTR
ncbi:MAG TPA: hypothetical protein VG710_09405 [Opitutus sp.]|nr:hypothetical protein [Opitutus sp.]